MNAPDITNAASFGHVEDLCERAVLAGDRDAPDIADGLLDRAEARLQLLRAKTAHARWLLAEDDVEVRARAEAVERASLESAEASFRRLEDAQGHGETLFWLGVFHQVVRGDQEAALAFLARARELAERTGDRSTAAYALRHLGIAEHRAGRLDAARDLLEQSCALRSDLGFDAGVASNLVGLAYISAAQGDAATAGRHLDRADELAGPAGADRVLEQVAEARAALTA